MRFIFFLSLVLGFSTSAIAGIAPDQAIRAIVGEAEGEPYAGKVAVGEAIRNRGSLRGVYGVASPRLKKAPAWVWRDARRAWAESEESNLVNGATHWEGTKFPRPYWAKNMTETERIGNQIFYRSK